MSEEKINYNLVLRTLNETIELLEQENQQLKENLENMNKIVAESWSVLDEIREKIDFAKATIEHDKGYDVGYNFLIDAKKIKEILDKVGNNE